MSPTSVDRRLAALVGALVVGLAATAAARPGGGQSYSGGGGSSYMDHSSSGSSSPHESHSSDSPSSHSFGSSSSSFGSSSSSKPHTFSWDKPGSSSDRSSSPFVHSDNGGSSGGLLIACVAALLFWLVVFHIFDLPRRLGLTARNSFDTSASNRQTVRPPRLDVLRKHDPMFSAVLFEDFLFTLYARAQTARSDRAELAALAPYIADATREALARREPTGVAVHGVVVGSMTVLAVEAGQRQRVTLMFEANYTAGGHGYYVQERWLVERADGVVSRPPAAVLSLHCPACGAPYVRSDAGRCAHCGQAVEGGTLDWTLTHVHLERMTPHPPGLLHYAEEAGTDVPTVLASDLKQTYTALVVADPGATNKHIEARFLAIYSALNTAYAANDLRTVRPFVSDALYNYLTYWIDAYRAQGLRNVLEDMQVSRVLLVKVVRDAHFDAVTLRFWATGRDYTVDRTGKPVAGNHRFARSYSEYWTLIRGAAVRGSPFDPAVCPNCAAPLDRVNMAGTCEYCGAHLTRGEFDWVLSKIEQDESYVG